MTRHGKLLLQQAHALTSPRSVVQRCTIAKCPAGMGQFFSRKSHRGFLTYGLESMALDRASRGLVERDLGCFESCAQKRGLPLWSGQENPAIRRASTFSNLRKIGGPVLLSCLSKPCYPPYNLLFTISTKADNVLNVIEIIELKPT